MKQDDHTFMILLFTIVAGWIVMTMNDYFHDQKIKMAVQLIENLNDRVTKLEKAKP